MKAQSSHSFRPVNVIGEYHTSLTCGDILDGVETEYDGF